MRRRGRAPLIAFAVALVAGAAVLAWALLRGPSAEDAGSALARAEAAFAQVRVYGDVSFFLHQASRLSGREVKAVLDDTVFNNRDTGLKRYEYYFWRNRYKEMPAVAAFPVRLEGAGFNPNLLADPRDPLEGARLQRTLRVITDAIDCEPGVPPVDTGAPPEYGYVVTHQLLGLLIAGERRCVEPYVVNQYAPVYITRIYSEMMAYRGELSDVQVERAAMLALVGRVELVPDRLVNALLEAQRPDGFWYFGQPGAESLNVIAHNSAVSYMVLAAWYGHARH